MNREEKEAGKRRRKKYREAFLRTLSLGGVEAADDLRRVEQYRVQVGVGGVAEREYPIANRAIAIAHYSF